MMRTLGIPSDRITVEFGSRHYGVDLALLPPEKKFLQEVPEIFRELAVRLRGESALLALNAEAEPPKRAIFETYAKDLALLKRHLSEFEACMKQAIRYSIIGWEREHDAQAAKEKVEKTWEVLKQQIPSIGKAPLLELPHTRAAKAAPELLAELKEEFERGIERVLRTLAFWLQTLVEQEFVGLVEWTDLDICRYHYFRHERTEEVLAEKKQVKQSYDNSKPLGERTTDETIRDQLIRRQQFNERHVHHVVESKLYRLEEYPHRVPNRIRNFLEVVPAWLRPLLQVVDGQITMEEILRRKVSEKTTVESEVVAVYKYSPGVLLGAFNLIGWSATDLEREETDYYRGQSAADPARRRKLRKVILAGVAVVLALGTGVSGITYLVKWDQDAKAQAYAAYVSPFTEQTIFETRKTRALMLPVEARPLYYAGLKNFNFGNKKDHIALTTQKELKSPVGSIPASNVVSHIWIGDGSRIYGDADLGPEFGIFVKLHVLSATDESIRYVATKYGE